jgi:hypothetical protein
LAAAERQIHVLERQAIRDQVEAEQRVLALLLTGHTSTPRTTAADPDQGAPSVDELRTQLQLLSYKYEELAESELCQHQRPAPSRAGKPKAGGLKVKAKRVLISDDELSDSEVDAATEGEEPEFSSDSDGEWMPQAKGKGSKKRQLSPNHSKKRTSGSSVGSAESQASRTSETSVAEQLPSSCSCKGMCVRSCVCKTAGRHCDGSCGCKHTKCKNRGIAVVRAIEPVSKQVMKVYDDSDDEFEFEGVHGKPSKAPVIPPTDAENPVQPPPTKRFKLQPTHPTLSLQLSDAGRSKLKAVQTLASAVDTSSALPL